MKSKEELKTLREEVETLNKKLTELTEEELNQVVGGAKYNPDVPLVQTIFPLFATSIGVDGRSPSVTIDPEECLATDVLKDKANQVIYQSSNN